MTNPSTIEAVVMKRVRRARIVRALFGGPVVAAAMFGLALYGIGREVWVARVFQNSPEGVVQTLSYLGYAFLHTRIIVQALSLTVLGALVYMAHSAARSIAGQLSPTYA